jgi:putative DNA primase/helicase
MSQHADANDTLRNEGVDALRTRHDRAKKYKPRSNSKDQDDDRNRTTILLPSPSNPLAVATVFINGCLHEGLLTLRFWRGGWWSWRTTHWVEVEERAVRSLLYRFTEHARYVEGKKLVAWSPTRRKISDLIDALPALCILPSDLDQPCWLDSASDVEGVVVAVGNGLLDVEQRHLMSHTPNFFNQTSVPFSYDPHAPAPHHWFRFLSTLWPNKDGANAVEIDVLGEWFGYVVSGRTDLHKILLMVGPTRGGKGAIARVLTAMVGRKSVAGPTLNSLGGEFGLAPLIGKTLAVISDARFAGKDSSIVVERLLSISGEDTLTVNRKYRDQWTGKLPSRLHVLSNELPKLGDASTAIVGRVVLLLLTKSWLGKEDHGLEASLQKELTGILNWALDGLRRLSIENRNSFTRLASAEEAVTAMRDLASPVAAFVREKCKIEPDAKVPVDALYNLYKQWTEISGHSKKSKHTFGRDLRAAVPAVSVIRPHGDGDENSRPRFYQGISISSP